MSNMESRNLKLKTVKEGLIDSVKLKNLILEDTDVLDGIIDFGNILAKSVMSGNKVLIFGKKVARKNRRMGVVLASGQNILEARSRADSSASRISIMPSIDS